MEQSSLCLWRRTQVEQKNPSQAHQEAHQEASHQANQEAIQEASNKA